MEVEALRDVTARVAGGSVRLRRGERYEMPAADALELERAGYVGFCRMPIEEATLPPVEQAVSRRRRPKGA